MIESIEVGAAGSASLRSPSPAALFDPRISELTSCVRSFSSSDTVLACGWCYRSPLGLNPVSTKLSQPTGRDDAWRAR